MEANLNFKLPEDQDEFKLSTDGGRWYCVAWELDQWLRDQIKYHEQDQLQVVRDELYNIIENNRVSLEDVS